MFLDAGPLWRMVADMTRVLYPVLFYRKLINLAKLFVSYNLTNNLFKIMESICTLSPMTNPLFFDIYLKNKIFSFNRFHAKKRSDLRSE